MTVAVLTLQAQIHFTLLSLHICCKIFKELCNLSQVLRSDMQASFDGVCLPLLCHFPKLNNRSWKKDKKSIVRCRVVFNQKIFWQISFQPIPGSQLRTSKCDS